MKPGSVIPILWLVEQHILSISLEKKEPVMSPKFSLKNVFYKVLLAILAVLITSQFQAFPRVKAWSNIPQSGRTGQVILPTIYVGDLLMPAGYTAFTLFGDTGPTVMRTPGSTGAQIVRAIYVVEKWNGYSWVTLTSAGPISAQILSTQAGYRFAAPYIQPVIAKGTFRFSWIFGWYTPAGAQIGTTIMVSNLVSDHVCVTPKRPCKSSAGYFQTGGLY
jgi:hypothetical protein